MDTKLTKRFWEDEGIAALTPEQKLALVWALTNGSVTVLGISEVTSRRFVFDTGLSIDALWSACEALPNSFVRDGNQLLAVNYIYYQLGKGKSLVCNNIFKSAVSQLNKLSSEKLKEILLSRIPEFQEYQHKLSKASSYLSCCTNHLGDSGINHKPRNKTHDGKAANPNNHFHP